MTKVLALLTLAVLSLSAMTGPAFAQSARVPLRMYGVVSSGLIRQTLLKSLLEKLIKDQRRGHALQPLPTASPRS